ncbi:immunogenic protein [Metarhizium album ARSEF 1941]|uniref:Immunogenic protein n=1 Tax=Metarhizium album (strain ARSEF 1941) TaxID=1081103 RepID=A0A0B2WL43_METAS|nr:immunogenic protein [Metarhizium album ARSEF 1941]KHN96746.1 immunogenic protein [Metarhizium album ARSEF 1941]
MAEEQKPVVELPKEETAPVPAVEAAEATPALAVEEKPAEGPEAKAAEEVKPVEEGHLGHKAQGAGFPKNLIPTKEFFFFGSDSFEPKSLASYLKAEKNTEQAHHNISWASHTGNGLLFMGDKKNPTSIINLADTTEPELDGSNKFHLNHKGNKHSFKAVTTAERDDWVARLRAKITEAKELVASVTESEAYKNTLESLKPKSAAVKEEKTEEETKPEEATKSEAAPAPEGEAAAAATTEEKTTEKPKRRSASRKRASIFGFGKKESAKEKRDDSKDEEPVAPEVTEPTEADAQVAEGEAPAATEDKHDETSKEKPSMPKRNSIFGNVFSKKEKKAAEVKPAEGAAPGEGEAVADTAAPVIPPVASSAPLFQEGSSAADNAEVTATNGAESAKKDVKEKSKSSLPFNFGKREKSPSPAEGEEKAEKGGLSAFSKLRATIKGKSGAKTEEKPSGEAVKEGATTSEAADPVEGPAKTTETEAENKPDNVATATPAVTAAA